MNTFPVPKGLRLIKAMSWLESDSLNTFPVPKGLRRQQALNTNQLLVFEHFPCSEGIKTIVESYEFQVDTV